jgi:hypothetical protein
MNRCATYQEMSVIKGEVLITRGTGLNWNFLEKNLNSDPDSVHVGTRMVPMLLLPNACF